jgi:mRNA deadenylase 3'-5' endonuclease subunit Ccr4
MKTFNPTSKNLDIRVSTNKDLVLLQKFRNHSFYLNFKTMCSFTVGDKKDGCATFVRDAKFYFIQQVDVEYNDIGEQMRQANQLTITKTNDTLTQKISTDDTSSEETGEGDSPSYKDYFTNSIAIILILGVKHRNAPLIIIANTHLWWKPKLWRVRLKQIEYLVQRISLLREARELKNSAVFICGDFNEPVNQHVFNFMKTNKMSFQHCFYPFLENNNNNDQPTDNKQESLENNNNNVLCFFGRGEKQLCTMYSSEYKGVIDFIWYTWEYAEMMEVLELPTVEHLKKICGDSLPNHFWSSDHVCIAAKFKLKGFK